MKDNANNKFKLILANMTQSEVLNFIWLYDQYICNINELRKDEKDWDISPLNIELFYHDVYKTKLTL